MESGGSSSSGRATPADELIFPYPHRANEEGVLLHSGKAPITITGPSEWLTNIHSCRIRMENDLDHWDSLALPATTQTVAAFNAVAEKLEQVFDILRAGKDDMDLQIRDRYLGILSKANKFSSDLYMGLANATEDVGEKLRHLATIQHRQQQTTAATELFFASLAKGKGPAPVPGGDQPPQAPSGPDNWAPAERFLEELRPLLIPQKKETARRPAMKTPDTFDGAYTNLRSWWELVKDYLEIHEPTMPTESIRIKFVGSLLRKEARRWYDSRARSLERRGNADTWALFLPALLARFTDKQQKLRDHEAIKALRYEGSIQDFLSILEELNSTVALTGSGLQDIIRSQITPEIRRAIYHKMGGLPEDDEALIAAVREAGIIEERSSG